MDELINLMLTARIIVIYIFHHRKIIWRGFCTPLRKQGVYKHLFQSTLMYFYISIYENETLFKFRWKHLK
jgi:hypothetical protein